MIAIYNLGDCVTFLKKIYIYILFFIYIVYILNNVIFHLCFDKLIELKGWQGIYAVTLERVLL